MLNRPTRHRRYLRLYELPRRGRARPRAGHHCRSHGHGGQGPTAALPPCQVRGRRRFRLRRDRENRRLDAARCYRAGLFRVPKPPARHQASLGLRCEACAAMGDLDFKFVAHHGEMVKQKMGGREELAGRDVIVVHRLLEEHSRREGRQSRLCGLQRRLCPNGRYRPGGARLSGAPRNHRHYWRRVNSTLSDLTEAWRKENEANAR